MTYEEFSRLLSEIFKTEKDSTGKVKRKGFPDGCEKCEINDKWQCENSCMWPENHWKYDEVRYYVELAQWANAGIDMNRIDTLIPDDFYKIALVRKML